MNLKNRLEFQDLLLKKNAFKNVFFYRICGTGMGAAASLLKEKGLNISGGDSNFYPPMSTYLERMKIPTHRLSDLKPDFYKQFDLIVVGNVVGGASDEARMIEELGVPFCSFPAAIGALVLSDVNVVGIAGTHGKTTTTYLATQVFENIQRELEGHSHVGYLIGGVMDERPSSRLGDGRYFFIESDEYDSAYFEKISKFRSYSLDSMILTSLEFDHADIFQSVENIKEEFRHVFPQLSKKVIMNLDYKSSEELWNEIRPMQKKLDWIPYGLEVKNGQSFSGPMDMEVDQDQTRFKIAFHGRYFDFVTNLIGTHNILNLTSVLLFALSENIPYEVLKKSVLNLKMVKRRQEVRGVYHGALVIDDFAHHPRAVDLTIDGIKLKYPERKIHVIMEPNSATARSSIFQEEFYHSLHQANSVIFTKPTRPTSVKGAKDLDIVLLTEDVKRSGRYGKVVGNLDELLQELEKFQGEDNLILILSNGTCLGLWESEFVKTIQKT